jgi:hypothetical protein
MIIVLDVVVGSTDVDLDYRIEYDMGLEPFQVLLEYDDTFPMATSDEMVILGSTQYYLSSQMEETETDFTQLILYQYVRDYVMESRLHFAKIAMNGVISFSSQITPDLRSRVLNRILESLSSGSHLYVDLLHMNGMTHVVNSTLLSIQGNEIVYSDGHIVEMPQSGMEEDTQEISRDMGHGMRNKVLFLCLLVPAIVIVVTVAVFALRLVREMNWKRSEAISDKLWWRNNEADSRQRGRKCDSETGYSSRDGDMSDISTVTRSFDT